MPKFRGEDSELKYAEWKGQLQGLLECADLTEPQKVGILLGALTGLAERQIQVFDEGDRNTTVRIFAALDELYKERIPMVQVRSQFFRCQQNVDEPVQSYVRRLRELHSKLQRHAPDEAPTDEHLKEQLLFGLEEGPLLQALRRHTRQSTQCTFSALEREARLLEEDQRGYRRTALTCTAVRGTNHRHCSQDVN